MDETRRLVVDTSSNRIPIEENVELLEQRVTVNRRPVDRVAADFTELAFRDATFEFVECAEELNVARRPHVVEEIVVRKDVIGHAEVVHDTVLASPVARAGTLVRGRLPLSQRLRDGWQQLRMRLGSYNSRVDLAQVRDRLREMWSRLASKNT